MIDEQLQDSDLEYKDVSKEDIPLILKQNEIDTKKLISTINHYNSVHVVTCWDAEKKRLFYKGKRRIRKFKDYISSELITNNVDID